VGLTDGDVELERLGADPSRTFRPVSPAPLSDPNLPGFDPRIMRSVITTWCRDVLAPSLSRELGARTDLGDLSLVLEIVLPDDRLSLTFDRHGAMRDGFDPEYDVLNVAAASMLVEVIESRRSWGEPLLAGALRSSIRGCSVERGRARPLSVAAFFPYYALSYRQSVERAAWTRAAEARAR
jgi:hypothetical protein